MDGDGRKPGCITLMGSGEMTEAMASVHRQLAAALAPPVRAAFLDTPAGFELNADDIARRGCAYLTRHAGIPCSIASFTSREAPPEEVRRALRKLAAANYLFAGPGSPTYTVRHWAGTDVFQAVVRRVEEGAQLVLASAAAIAVGRFALPVYEIYKVGEAPHWVDGLDLLGRYGLEVAVVTHWNNAEGAGYDSRFCFMGEPRFRQLEAALPASTVVLGIDEYTACIIDPAGDECRVMGAGGVTLRRGGHEERFETASTFPLERLRPAKAAPAREPVAVGATGGGGETARRREVLVEQVSRAGTALPADDGETLVEVAGEVYDLAEAVERARAAGVEEAVTADAGRQLGRLLADWSSRLTDGATLADVGPFVDLLVEVRAQLRAGRNWALADAIRDRLHDLGVVLEDSPGRTAWRRV